MRRNRLTLCITNYPNDLIGKTYILNYSFDNYNTFGFITIDTMKWIKSRDYHLE
jgi:hypothetical protein